MDTRKKKSLHFYELGFKENRSGWRFLQNKTHIERLSSFSFKWLRESAQITAFWVVKIHVLFKKKTNASIKMQCLVGTMPRRNNWSSTFPRTKLAMLRTLAEDVKWHFANRRFQPESHTVSTRSSQTSQHFFFWSCYSSEAWHRLVTEI